METKMRGLPEWTDGPLCPLDDKTDVRRNATSGYEAGFTLVEMISMLIIMGILAAVAIPRFFNRQTFDARIFFDQTQSMMRYAQKLAIAQNRNVHVRLDGASFAFCFNAFAADGSCDNQVPPPAGANSGSAATLAACGNSNTWFCEAIPAGIAYMATPSASSFFFNALGQPSTSGKLDITLSSGGALRHIFVEHDTGYVHQ
jgi:MSHA pilin protein MshC